jgi:PAS domain S-box-containing protein
MKKDPTAPPQQSPSPTGDGSRPSLPIWERLIPGRQRIEELEQALAQSEAQRQALEKTIQQLGFLERIINIVPHGLFWRDRHGVFLGCNRTFAALVGLANPNDIIGKTNKDLHWQGNETEIYQKQDRDVIEGNRMLRHVIQPFRRADGVNLWVDSTKVPIHDERGKLTGILGIFDDVTELKKTEEALRQSESQFRALFATMNEGASLHEIILDDKGKPCDYRFLEVNPIFEKITGIPREQWIGRTAREVLPNIESTWIERYGEVALTGNPIRYEEYSQDLDRYYSVTAYCPKPGQFAVLSLDITEHKKAEEYERLRRQKLDLLVEQSPLAVIEWGLDFKITEWNAAAVRIFGFQRPETLGKSITELIVPREIRPSVQSVLQALLQGMGGTHNVNDNLTLDGRRITCQWHNTALVDRSGKIVGGVSMGQDITEQKRTEEHRKKLEDQMQQVQKLESLGVLAGGIAHDFNNLLMAILGNADLALAELPSHSPGRDHIREIEIASRRAADLCRQMLAYSGKGRFIVETVSLSDLVGEMVHLLKTSISKKALLNLNLEKNLPNIRADITQIRQIVMNLVINASEAIGERSGVITVSTGAMECPADYLREVYLNENLTPGFYVWLEVSDTGCGMDAATKSRIFEPFFTTKFTGRGLGLSAVLGIVRGHKGALKIYTEQGKGTTFKLLFPANKDDATGRKNAPDSMATWNGRNTTILLVDDEETIRATGKMLLTRLGFNVLLANDGREAIGVYEQHRNEIVGVLLDLTMPHLNGEETFRELRRLNPKVKVVMSSGYSETDVSSRFMGKGLAGFIQKPYTRTELANCLRNSLGDAPGNSP